MMFGSSLSYRAFGEVYTMEWNLCTGLGVSIQAGHHKNAMQSGTLLFRQRFSATKVMNYATMWLSKIPQSPECVQAGYAQSVSMSSCTRVRETLPAAQPCIISSFPCILEVMKMTSAPKLSHVSLSSFTVSGRPPRFFESQRIIRSGSMCL
jgi:hypothetical protein